MERIASWIYPVDWVSDAGGAPHFSVVETGFFLPSFRSSFRAHPFPFPGTPSDASPPSFFIQKFLKGRCCERG